MALIRRLDTCMVVVSFAELWVLKYGVKKTLISYNGSKCASKVFQGILNIMGIDNLYKSTYHEQNNGQNER